jgi:hypothetical protein
MPTVDDLADECTQYVLNDHDIVPDVVSASYAHTLA